jgi:hypothetical protein
MTENANEQKNVIPLSHVWAYAMPGTRDISQLETDKPPNYSYGPLVKEIRSALSAGPKEGGRPRPCFTVAGSGLEALREAHAVLTKDQKPRQTFPAGSAISIVFFSQRAGSYVHLHEITNQGNVIILRYRFVPHETRQMSEHFALIPITGMSEGKVRVEIIQSPMEKSFLDSGFRPIAPADAGSIVCRSCSFNFVSEAKN